MTQNQINYFKVKEDQRHNLAMEEEQRRSNREQERIKSYEAETTRTHYDRADSETQRANLTKEQQNLVVLGQKNTELIQEAQKIGETKRHNQAVEQIDWYNADSSAKQAEARLITANSTAALNRGKEIEALEHSTLLARQAETEALKPLQTSAQTQLTYAQTANAIVDTDLKQSTREKVIMETSVIPINTIGGLFRNLSLGGLIR